MKYSALFLATLPAFLGSCMIGPNYSEPLSDLEKAWNEHDASLVQGSNSKINLAWWTQFHDPTLNQLVESAYSQNLGLRAAALRILESRAILGISQGNMFPQSQSLNGDYIVADKINQEQTGMLTQRPSALMLLGNLIFGVNSAVLLNLPMPV